MKTVIIIIAIFVAVVIILACGTCLSSNRDNYVNTDNGVSLKQGCKMQEDTLNVLPVKIRKFNKILDPNASAVPPDFYVQNQGPSLGTENMYHECVRRECKGNYTDTACMQYCYLVAMKDGTTDIKDRICEGHESPYDCLNEMYSDSRVPICPGYQLLAPKC